MKQITKTQLLNLAESISRQHSEKAVLDYRPDRCGILIPWPFLWFDELKIISRRLNGICWHVDLAFFNEFYFCICIPSQSYKC